MYCRKSLDLSGWILNSSIIVDEKITIRILDLVKRTLKIKMCIAELIFLLDMSIY
jgi:hypothetical protein